MHHLDNTFHVSPPPLYFPSIMTTCSHMIFHRDEADLLGDRIGILAEGQLRCCGSSLFLKKEFGVGYQISIDKISASERIDETVTDIIMNAVPEATVLSNVSSELSFQLPLDSSSQFVSMFSELDKIVESREISMYGVSITTLEEVFIMVGRGETGNREILASSLKNVKNEGGPGFAEEVQSSNASYASAENISSKHLFGRHVQALLQKRALNFKRDKKAWVSTSFKISLLFAITCLTNQGIISHFPMLRFAQQFYLVCSHCLVSWPLLFCPHLRHLHHLNLVSLIIIPISRIML